MNKLLKKHRVMSNRDSHIHSLRILAFVIDGINFTEKEDAHFDACRVCRLKVIDALRNLGSFTVATTMAKAA